MAKQKIYWNEMKAYICGDCIYKKEDCKICTAPNWLYRLCTLTKISFVQKEEAPRDTPQYIKRGLNTFEFLDDVKKGLYK